MEAAELLLQARSGDPSAWDALVDRYERLVWAVVRSFGLDHADALDVAQLVWLRLVENIDKIKEPERIGSWLTTTTKRECIKVVDRRKRSRPTDYTTEFRLLQDPKDPIGRVLDKELVNVVYAAFDTLGADCQSLLRLVLVEPPMAYTEISDVLGVPVGTIGPRRMRCLGRLRAAAGL